MALRVLAQVEEVRSQGQVLLHQEQVHPRADAQAQVSGHQLPANPARNQAQVIATQALRASQLVGTTSARTEVETWAEKRHQTTSSQRCHRSQALKVPGQSHR